MRKTMIGALALIALSATVAWSANRRIVHARNISTSTPPSTKAAVDTTRLRAMMTTAHAKVFSHPIEAERIYRAVIEEQRTAKIYAPDALRSLAQLHDTWNDASASARTLEELAETAAAFGDSGTRLRALFDAAYQWQGLHRADRASTLLREICPLLKSPAIEETVRKEIAGRTSSCDGI